MSSRRTAPIRTRTSRVIGAPTAANMRRTCRFQPWRSTTRYQARPSVVGGPRSACRRVVSTGLAGRTGWANVARPSSMSIPSSSAARCSFESQAVRPTEYSRSTPKRGCSTRSAHSPSLVTSSRPSLSRSSRPTGYRRASEVIAVGSSWRTVRSAWRSATVEVTPAGLWSARWIGAAGAPRGMPSTSIRTAAGSTWSPTLAGRPFTVTRPATMSASLARRDATPAVAMIFCNRSAGISRRSHWGPARSPGRPIGRPDVGAANPRKPLRWKVTRPRPGWRARRRRQVANPRWPRL